MVETGRETRLAAGLRRRRRSQGGFTMIEMLVVIAILGVLAAVVTMSLVGVTQAATHRSQDQELMTVQSAMNFMIMDQLIDPADACSLYADGTSGTNDMSRYPSQLPFVHSGGNGEPTDRKPVQLYPHYLRTRTLSRAYVCEVGGTVRPAG
jgi:prepilin-type N-terminal cleavage/methylation domain-containing protein